MSKETQLKWNNITHKNLSQSSPIITTREWMISMKVVFVVFFFSQMSDIARLFHGNKKKVAAVLFQM